MKCALFNITPTDGVLVLLFRFSLLNRFKSELFASRTRVTIANIGIICTEVIYKDRDHCDKKFKKQKIFNTISILVEDMRKIRDDFYLVILL